MKKIGFILLLLASTSVFAFGGGGGGHTSKIYKRHTPGVNSFGIHVHENAKNPDIKFKCDDPNATPNRQGVCECNDGYEMKNGVCVPKTEPTPPPEPITCNSCEDLVGEQCVPRTCGTNEHCDVAQDECVCDEGYLPDSQNVCVLNQCPDFQPTDCITDCDPITGSETYATLCHNDEYYCNNNHECTNPCDEATYDHECQTCTPQGQSADIQNKTGTCGTSGAYVCQSGSCVDPCTIGEHPTDACTPSWHAENGTCVPDYAQAGTSCGTNMVCDDNHECICPEGYFWNGSACFTPCTKANNFHRLSGTCLACDSNTRVETTEAECNTCGSQRKVVEDGDKTYCATTNCGSGNFQDAKGTCHACTINTSYPVETEEACTTACSTRHVEVKEDQSLSCVKGCAEGYEEVDGKCQIDLCANVTCDSGKRCTYGVCINEGTQSDSCVTNDDCNVWCDQQKQNNSQAATCYCFVSYNPNFDYDVNYGKCNVMTQEQQERGYDSGGTTWWTASNFCKAIGKSMVTKEDTCTTDTSCLTTPIMAYWLADCDGENCNDASPNALIVGGGSVFSNPRNGYGDVGTWCK